MGNYNRSNSGKGRGNGFGGRDSGRSFGGGKRFGGRDRERPTMHEAICSECGRECEIPFRPTGDRPVFCSDCFSNQDNSGSGRQRGNGRGNDRGRQDFGSKKMFEATCDSCGNECEVPFHPTQGKPVFCNDCFGKDNKGSKSNDSGKKNHDSNKDQFGLINAKLDKILNFLKPHVENSEVIVEELVQTEVEPKEKKVKTKKIKEVKEVVEEVKVEAKKKKEKKKK